MTIAYLPWPDPKTMTDSDLIAQHKGFVESMAQLRKNLQRAQEDFARQNEEYNSERFLCYQELLNRNLV